MTADVFIVRLARPDRLHERFFLTRDAVVADIVTEELAPASDITAVIHIYADHCWDDETEAVARAVSTEVEHNRDGECSDAVISFVHDYAGSAWARGLRVEDRSFAA